MYSIAYEKKSGIMGWFKRKLFNRKVYFSELANKIAGSLGNNATKHEWQAVLTRTGLGNKIPKTALGKWLVKFNQIFLEGATNRVAGGKLAAAMQAAYLADVIYKSAKQEGGISEKAKSLAERTAEMIAFFACIPLSLKLMHKVGGLQYLGMDKDAIDSYRTALKLHNEKAMNRGFNSKLEWKRSKNTLKGLLKGNVNNPLYKLLKKVGSIVTVGLEQIRPFDKNPVVRKGIMGKIKDLLHHPIFGLKQMAGYPMRIALGMMVILPFLSKLVVKGTHMIVGKPKHSILDEGKEEQVNNANNPNSTQLPQQLQTEQNPNAQSDTNLLDQYKNPNQRANGDTNTYIPSPEPFRPKETPEEPYRTYVPSPMGAQIANNEDLTEADAALKRADVAEKLALETLKMR